MNSKIHSFSLLQFNFFRNIITPCELLLTFLRREFPELSGPGSFPAIDTPDCYHWDRDTLMPTGMKRKKKKER